MFGTSAIDLTPAVEQALGPDWKGLLSPTGVDALTVDGELKALASGAVFSGIVWINQDLFDEYGLTRRLTGTRGRACARRSRPTT